MRYSLLAPGKRLRPALVVLAAEACGRGGRVGDPWPAASAVEMIHAYSLIHDDLPAMDDDDLRRGLPTCHKKFGEALAILAGDALQTTAFQALAEGYPPATAAAACKELARAAGPAGMIGGQVDDMAAEGTRGQGTRGQGRRGEKAPAGSPCPLPLPLSLSDGVGDPGTPARPQDRGADPASPDLGALAAYAPDAAR